ncbi:hypothetical protein BRCON_2641 [Candidatus Sumerlaea chitinivorans]|uniref:Uncharacterized protein n=1 Tax=Sumerlaea chitinivorans TaxID=2250252 RepID=A0A2Z4YAD1_SUMC1|nr:hypothetical protein BRCON_2641 [Candidatus Sumerlaea chitinivorans]
MSPSLAPTSLGLSLEPVHQRGSLALEPVAPWPPLMELQSVLRFHFLRNRK